MSSQQEEPPVEETADSIAEEVESAATGNEEAAEAPVEEVDLTPAAEVEKWKDVAARAHADLDNFRKRMAREKTEAREYANRSLLEQLLPIFDNFEMGLKAAHHAEGESSNILMGLSMVQKQFGDFLTSQGVEPVGTDGLPFDPNQHDALKQEPSETVPEGHVIYTMRKGYRLRDRLLRAANVVVSSGPSEESENEAS